MPRHPATLFGPQRLAAVTTVLAVGMVLPSMINSGGTAANGARPTSQSPVRCENGVGGYRVGP